MRVSPWKSGKTNLVGGTYGIRVGRRNRKTFSRDWKEIVVEVGGKQRSFFLGPLFWTTCPEFRDYGEPIIRRWLKDQGYESWERHHGPHFELIHLHGATFRLQALTDTMS